MYWVLIVFDIFDAVNLVRFKRGSIPIPHDNLARVHSRLSYDKPEYSR